MPSIYEGSLLNFPHTSRPHTKLVTTKLSKHFLQVESFNQFCHYLLQTNTRQFKWIYMYCSFDILVKCKRRGAMIGAAVQNPPRGVPMTNGPIPGWGVNPPLGKPELPGSRLILLNLPFLHPGNLFLLFEYTFPVISGFSEKWSEG